MNANTHNLLYVLLALLPLMLSGCIEDGVTTAQADQPEFSVESLDMGTVFTDTPSPTRSFVVYNRHDKILNISNISLSAGASSCFRLNVDGEAARSFSNIEIRPNDSIFVFVETTVPPGGAAAAYEPFEISDRIDFLTNGTTRSVALKARGQDVEDHRDATLSADTRWDGHPRRIFGTLTIPEGVTLTVGPGVTVYLHDTAAVVVDGRLIIDGEPDSDDRPGMVTFRGDRLDTVVGDSPFDLLASQWEGIIFSASASGSRISHADIRGMSSGIVVEGGPDETMLTIENSRLHRSGGNLLTAGDGTALSVTGCELSDSRGALVSLTGGRHSFVHCSLVNYYISSFDVGPLVHIDGEAVGATFANCLLKNYRNNLYVSPGDLAGTDVWFKRAAIGTSGSDDDNFTDCLWGADIQTNVNPDSHIYDYTLKPSSAGVDAGDPSLLTPQAMTDMNGTPRHTAAPTIGAYEIK